MRMKSWFYLKRTSGVTKVIRQAEIAVVLEMLVAPDTLTISRIVFCCKTRSAVITVYLTVEKQTYNDYVFVLK